MSKPPLGGDLGDGLATPGDVVVVKRTIGAFYGTGLHEHLSRLQVGSRVW